MENQTINYKLHNLKQKRNNQLKIDCSNCSLKNVNKKCFECILNHFDNKEKIFDEIWIKTYKLSYEETKILIYLADLKRQFKNNFKMIRCKNNFEECIHNKNLIELFKPFNFSQFLSIMNLICENKLFSSNQNHQNKFCIMCMKQIYKKIKIFKNIYEKSKLNLLLREKYGIFYPSITKIFDLFSIFNQKVNNLAQDSLCLIDYKKKDTYVFFNEIYISEIFENSDLTSNFYKNYINLPDDINEKQFFYVNFFRNKLDVFDLKYHNIEEKIKKISFKISNLLINYFPKLKGNIKKLSLLISTKYLNIDKIFPLLVDPYVEEIFYDSQKDNFYINHQKFGRCNTNLNLSDVEVEALITHLRFESKKRLDFNHPSLIHVINNEYFHCRFSIDIYPSHWKDFSFDIRKLNKKTFTLFNLISLNTMNKDMVNFLIFCVLFKINITIAGEVNSGKTTLLNSIDLVIPKNFRKIYVEETIESLEIPSKYGHQLKYHVKSQYQEENSQKNQEIYKLLHRSGDIIILGEILNKSETKALFHCLSAGLNGMQTTHASNLDSLINRWIIHFKINQNCLNDLGIVIFMKKIGLNRKILSINEIYYNKNEEKIEYHQIYKYFPKSDDWKSDYLFQDTKLFKKINEFLNLSLEKFQNILNVIDENTSEKLSINSPSKQFIYNPINEIYSKLKKIDKNLGEL